MQEILDKIKSGEIRQVSVEPTDTLGMIYDAEYIYNDQLYCVSLSAYGNGSYEEQAAEQIWDYIQKEEREL